jgi:type II secretory pathway predicted ATPase ExeA
MYQSHFGLSRPLFSDGLAQDEAVFRTEAAEQTARELAAALSRRDAVAILSGASGTGKTTLAADALKSVGTRLAFTCISQPPLTAHEMLEQLLTDFGFEPYRRSRVERLQLWRQFLSEMTATDSRVCLLVESADSIPQEVLLALHGLTAADAALSRGANIILTTNQQAESLLVTPEMLAFNQRVCLRRRIEALCGTEVLAYLEFKCQLAGAIPDQIFGTGVAAALYEYSGGIIRVIDNLLDAALGLAASAGERPLNVNWVVAVAEQRFGLSRMAPAEVNELLAATAVPGPTNLALPGNDLDPDDIPILTEFLSPKLVERIGPGQHVGRAALG